MAAADPTSALDLGQRFIDAIVAHDWDALAACFAAEARFTAVIPRDNAFRERIGAEAAAKQLQAWFGDADVTELVSSEVEAIADRVKISYRIQSTSPTGGISWSRWRTPMSATRASPR